MKFTPATYTWENGDVVATPDKMKVNGYYAGFRIGFNSWKLTNRSDAIVFGDYEITRLVNNGVLKYVGNVHED